MSSNQPNPDTEVYDLGVIKLGAEESVENHFVMPFDGYIQRVSPSWPPGSNNAIGFNMKAELPEKEPADISTAIQEFVEETRYFLPANHPNPEYITDDNVYIPFFPFERIPQGVRVTAEIKNGSTSNPLDLQLRCTVTNFDPRQVTGGVGTPTGGRRGGDR